MRFRDRVKGALMSPPMAIGAASGSFWGIVRESFTGAWQRNIEVDSLQNLLTFSAVYACVSLISDDIAKLRPRLMHLSSQGTWDEVMTPSPFWPVLRKPNNYQTRIQFISQWVLTKLLYGNVYVLKERVDARGIVTGLHVLDPGRLVTPLVSPDGSVFYQIGIDWLAGVEKTITVPASEIIHDRMITPWHPLIGVTPIYACGAASTQGKRIQANSVKFFENMSRPSGVLTSPNNIPDETAKRLKADFEQNFSGANIGRVLVAGDGLKYEVMTIPAADSQLIEQLRWTVEDVARCFRVPLHKLAITGASQTAVNLGAMNQDYYAQTLQTHIEAMELLLDEGLGLPATYGIEFDLEALLRMDPLARMETLSKGVLAGIVAPNEGRFKENYPPVPGGENPYLQQQNYSLAALAKRDALAFAAAGSPPPVPAPAIPAPAPSSPPPKREFGDEDVLELVAAVAKELEV